MWLYLLLVSLYQPDLLFDTSLLQQRALEEMIHCLVCSCIISEVSEQGNRIMKVLYFTKSVHSVASV